MTACNIFTTMTYNTFKMDNHCQNLLYRVPKQWGHFRILPRNMSNSFVEIYLQIGSESCLSKAQKERHIIYLYTKIIIHIHVQERGTLPLGSLQSNQYNRIQVSRESITT